MTLTPRSLPSLDLAHKVDNEAEIYLEQTRNGERTSLRAAVPAPVEYRFHYFQNQLVDPTFEEPGVDFIGLDGSDDELVLDLETETVIHVDDREPLPVRNNGWGFVTQGMTNDIFYVSLTYDFRLERLIPHFKELGATWIRDLVLNKHKGVGNYGAILPVYGGGQELIDVGPELHAEALENQALVNSWYDMYDRAGFNLIVVLLAAGPIGNGQHVLLNQLYTDFLVDFVQKHSCIKVIELHNEPNLPQFWVATEADFVNIYRPIAQAIKAARPDIIISGPGIATVWWQPAIDWLTTALDLGMLDFCDAMSVHPYRSAGSNFWPPEADPFFNNPSPSPITHPNYTNPNSAAEGMAGWYALISSYKPGLPIYYTEVGWSSASAGAFSVRSDEKQGAYLSRLMLVEMDNNLRGVIPVEAICWYNFLDTGIGDSEQRCFGLMRSDYKYEKISFQILHSICSYFPDWSDLTPIDISVSAADNPTAVKTMAFERASDGAIILCFWRLDQISPPTNDFDTTLMFNPGVTAGSITLFMPGRFMEDGEDVYFAQESGEITIDVRMRWRAQWLEIIE